MTRMRQSEWRRRWGIAGLTVLDLQVSASTDDGFSNDIPGFNDSSPLQVVGADATPNSYECWARFLNVTIPAGATIQTAFMTVVPRNVDDDGAGVKADIFFNDEDNAARPTDRADHVAKSRTTAFTAWDDASMTTDADEDSPSIVTGVQEVVDRGSWASGNAMMILFDDGGSSNNKHYDLYSYDDTPAKATKLHVEYTG